MSGPQPVRLLSGAGASFALLPVPDLTGRFFDLTIEVDVELLTPDRLVRYLGRTLTRDTVVRLRDAWMQAAHETLPEQTVTTVQDDDAGLVLLVTDSSPFTVTLEFTVSPDLDAQVPERDAVAFDVARSGLVDASHAISEWLT